MKNRKIKKFLSILGACTLLLSTANIPNASLQAKESTSVFEGSIILGRPTYTDLTINILSQGKGELYVEWGEASGKYTHKSPISQVEKDSPITIVLGGLIPDKEYYYRVAFKGVKEDSFQYTEAYQFVTPKKEGNSFNFVIQSDSHLLNKADPELYQQNMEKMSSLQPDFIFDLGDTFLNDKDISTISYEQVDEIYKQQLPYLTQVARSAPLFLALGNHEGEFGGYLEGSMNNVAAMSTKARTTYYPNPIPNEFYSGNEEIEPLLGAPQNYYAFTWGDALFVTIDPYRYSEITPYGTEDGWGWTLGKKQYDWFRKTLEESTAKYKFVFAHHAIGNMRGGEQVANLYEWGGYDRKGNYLFDEKRPGWGKPIHQIMKDTGVTVFFQGHDHLFAREDVDGVTYQTLPKPAEKIADNQSNYTAYPNGDVLMNSGFLNVTVSPENVQIDYIRNYYVSSQPQEVNTGVVYSYTIDENGKISVLKHTKDDLMTYGKNIETINKSDKNNNSSKDKDNKGKGNNKTSNIVFDSFEMTPIPKDGISIAIQADSHLDENTNYDLYKKTLNNIVSHNPRLLIDLGDTFMAEKFAHTEQEVEARYKAAKGYFDQLGNIPIYLVNGNHEGENGLKNRNNGSDISEWARKMRLKYFPNTKEKGIISGNTQTANYYTFIEGEAQFIVLDPYTYTTDKGKTDEEGWSNTLGKVQYEWLKETLENSNSKYKFVFIHNLVGGSGKDNRGGAEASRFFEWGGYNLDGTYGFDDMRPGWELPIHELLVKYDVDIVFHGHDHFYSKQEREGIVYQLVPQPGTPGRSIDDATVYSYEKGEFLPSAGYLRMVISKEQVVVEYIYTTTGDQDNEKIIARYELMN